MARHEADREDLFAEATALVRRAEFSIDGHPDVIVVGFRRDGALSVYLGADPVFHFNAAGRLKRAFIDDKLYRTQGDTLAELTRRRTATETILHRHDLEPPDVRHVLQFMRAKLITPMQAIEAGRISAWKSAPAVDATLPADVATFLRRVLDTPVDELLAPRFRGKR